METTEVFLIIIWIIILIEITVISIQAFRTKQLNHLPRFNYPFEEVCFEINNIKYIERDVVEYTAVVCFFKKPNAKHFVHNKYRFYDIKYKYNIGDKLYLNKRQ